MARQHLKGTKAAGFVLIKVSCNYLSVVDKCKGLDLVEHLVLDAIISIMLHMKKLQKDKGNMKY